MARQAHLDAARHHLETANIHLEVANNYRDGDQDAAQIHSREAWAASQVADLKSAEAHAESRRGAAAKLG
jgi:hypothetical protein